VRAWAQPDLVSVSPFFGGRDEETRVTVFGRNFGSETSRGYSADSYSARAYVSSDQGWTPCKETTYVSDEELVCLAPAGSGLRDMRVDVDVESTLNPTRAGILNGALLSVDLWVGGFQADPECKSIGAPWPHPQDAQAGCGRSGFVAAGPGRGGAAEVVNVALNISAAVR
jgi:hypothetical protein